MKVKKEVKFSGQLISRYFITVADIFDNADMYLDVQILGGEGTGSGFEPCLRSTQARINVLLFFNLV
jgi:hypothetical protein